MSMAKLKCPLSVPKGKISGSLLPGMNLRIISLSTEWLTSFERKRNAIEHLSLTQCFTKKKKGKKIKKIKRQKNSSYAVINISWKHGLRGLWITVFLYCGPACSWPAFQKRCHIYLSIFHYAVNRRPIRSGSSGSTSATRDWQSSG